MSKNTTILLIDNEYIKELFGILEENGKDATGLAALINHVCGMEDFVKQAEAKIADMKAQLDTIKEIQDRPVKKTLQKTVKALEEKVAEIKKQVAEIKEKIIEGCKNAVETFGEKGVAALDKLASFFHIKNGLLSVKNSTVQAADNCDKAVESIETFAKQYHTAGRGLKNMARMILGKNPVDSVKEAGNLAKIMCAPYRAGKAIQLAIRNQVNNAVAALEIIEESAEAKRSEREAKPKKPTLKERLEAKKAEIKQRELEKPVPDRTPKAQEMGL